LTKYIVNFVLPKAFFCSLQKKTTKEES